MAPSMAQQHLERADVYVPRPLQAWRALMNWLALFFQIFLQILRGTPSLAQVLSYIGLRQSFLSSASSSPSPPPTATDVSFKPLPVVEIPLQEDSFPPHCMSSSDSDVSVEEDKISLDKFTVVLDLDETLVCAYDSTSLPEIVRTQAIEAGLKWFELECVSSDKECDGKPKINYVTVFERPGLQEFLKGVAKFANLILFTAGLEDYARPLVDRIDKEKLITQRLYRPSTVSTWMKSREGSICCGAVLDFPIIPESKRDDFRHD